MSSQFRKVSEVRFGKGKGLSNSQDIKARPQERFDPFDGYVNPDPKLISQRNLP
jgi:hypothetical protein